MPGFGVIELVIILAIVILVFGAGRLGDLGGALSKGINEFRGATSATPDRACSACAQPAPAGAKFCGSCGQRLA
jgi:sec-independent protein translocase protein TatA